MAAVEVGLAAASVPPARGVAVAAVARAEEPAGTELVPNPPPSAAAACAGRGTAAATEATTGGAAATAAAGAATAATTGAAASAPSAMGCAMAIGRSAINGTGTCAAALVADGVAATAAAFAPTLAEAAAAAVRQTHEAWVSEAAKHAKLVLESEQS